MVRADALPADVRRHVTLVSTDHADAFRLPDTVTHAWPARRWAEHVLAWAPLTSRAQLLGGWLGLGLRLDPRRSDRVLGWPVHTESTDHVLLATRSPLGISAQLLFARHGSDWWFGTLLQLDRRVARAAWSVI